MGGNSMKKSKQEALMYLSEVIQANRAIKEVMLKNTYYSILLMSGVYYIFKDSKRILDICLALISLALITIFSYYFLKSNNKTISKLQNGEKDWIIENNLNTIHKFWAGDSLKLEGKNPFYFSYLVGIILTCFMLIFLLIMNNIEVKKTLCKSICLPITQEE